MARARVTAATLRRLNAVEAQMDAPEKLGGVLLVPAIIQDYDAWEAIAIPQLRALAEAAAEDIDHRQAEEPVRAALPGPLVPQVEGVHFHRPDPLRSQQPVPRPKRTPATIR